MVDLKIKLLLLCLIITTPVYAGYAEQYQNMKESNAAMKTCLLANGYEGSVFFTYSFEKAAACWGDWKAGQLTEEYIKTKLWLEENPWYKGPHWNWEEISKQYPGIKRIEKY
jgi:hypothetical protein